MSSHFMRHRVSAKPWSAILCLGLAGVACPLTAGAQTAPVAVSLDLYTGDKDSKGFADALTAAVSDDARFALVTPLPADGMKIIMKDALLPQNEDMKSIGAYDVVLKLGTGKYIDEKQGFCDLAKLTMCGRVVAQDSFDAYQSYMAGHKTK